MGRVKESGDFTSFFFSSGISVSSFAVLHLNGDLVWLSKHGRT